MDEIAFAQIRRGEFVGAVDNHMIGRVVGDYSTGFWAIKLDGRRLPRYFASPDEAFAVLALEFAYDRSAVAA